MLRTLVAAGVVSLAFTGSAMAAPCSATQEQEAGKLAAALVKSKVSEVVPVEGKQLININSCDHRGGAFTVDFRYNFTGSAGLFWLEGEAVVDASGSGQVKAKKASDNLKSADSGKILLAAR